MNEEKPNEITNTTTTNVCNDELAIITNPYLPKGTLMVIKDGEVDQVVKVLNEELKYKKIFWRFYWRNK